MKKLLMLVFVLCAAAVLVPSRAEEENLTLVISDRQQGDMRYTKDPAFMQWLLSTFETGEREEHPCTNRESYRVSIVQDQDRRYVSYSIYHDSLNNRASVITLNGIYSLDPGIPMLLQQYLHEPLSFSIPEDHRTLLAEQGWTIALRHPHMPVKLPDSLAASRTDPAALHFTWADLFLRDAGYDITPYLGQVVMPYVYTLRETVNRVAWVPSDAEFLTEDGTGGVLYSMRAVVLECGGEVIGAYLIAYSLDGSNLMSLNGRSPIELLDGSGIREYLLERLPVTDEEAALAALTPEEVIVRYGASNDPMLMDIAVLLSRLSNASSALYDPFALMARPTGMTYTVERKLPFTDEHQYEVTSDDALYFPQLVQESPETGWKIRHFYNTGV